jgi:hypothetical protein
LLQRSQNGFELNDDVSDFLIFILVFNLICGEENVKPLLNINMIIMLEITANK